MIYWIKTTLQPKRNFSHNLYLSIKQLTTYITAATKCSLSIMPIDGQPPIVTKMYHFWGHDMDENDLKKVVFVLLEDNFQQDAACQHGGKTYMYICVYFILKISFFPDASRSWYKSLPLVTLQWLISQNTDQTYNKHPISHWRAMGCLLWVFQRKYNEVQVTHICISNQCHHWLRWWLLSCWVPSHYLNQH